MSGVLEALICASERAANVARSCCTGSDDETLLVAEKGKGDANTRFEKDFKTIADVLAQECAKHEIGSRYPELEKYVRGEECPDIGGVCIELQNAPDKTAELLGYVVPDATASRMAKAAHSPIGTTLVDLPEDLPSFNTEDLAVWIDPIDATAEFISGVNGTAKADSGLPCVTVLIGAYLRSTGEPVLGVINQPFFDNGKGRIIWGVNYEGTQQWGGSKETSPSSGNVVLMSGGEKPDVIEKFTQSGWDVKMYPGAGHKLLKVALGEAAAYIVSQGTTYRWDTCAPHAIIRARGGNVVNFSAYEPIEYNAPESVDTQTFCNCNGIIAYNEQGTLEKIKNLLL